MGTEVALPLSLQELAGFLQVTEGIRGPSQVHGAEVGVVVGMQGRLRLWASHRVKPRPPLLIGPGSRPITSFCPQPWQGGQGLPLLTLPEVVTTEYLLSLIRMGQSLYK